jgi:hypothetical protein
MDLSEYARLIQRDIGADRYTNRQALKHLIEQTDSNLRVEHDARRAEAGGPDMVVSRGSLPVAYILTTSVGSDLASLAQRAERLRDALPNVLLTNYLEVASAQQRARLANLRSDQIEIDRGASSALNMLRQSTYGIVRSSMELAQRLGRITALLRDILTICGEGDAPDPVLLARRAALDPAITPAQFADQYAQAITFGLVAARLRHAAVGRQQLFNLRDAVWDQPPTSPFMRTLCRGLSDLDSRSLWLVEAVASLLAHADTDAVRGDFSRRSRQEDPLSQLYVTFRASYAGGQVINGPPETLAIYLVHAVQYLLHRRFKRALGLADEGVSIFNPAVGSGVLLFFVIQQTFDTLRQQHQLGAWDSYVSADLLPRVYGNEASLAAYALAHLKIGLQLETSGYRFASPQRLNVYLMPAAGSPDVGDDSFTRALAEEILTGKSAPANLPVRVLIGQFDDSREAMDCARQTIDETEGGIAALILPARLLTHPEDQALRAEVLRDYSDVYLLAMPEIAICIFLRRPNWQGSAAGRIHYATLKESAEANQVWLAEHALTSTNWQDIHPQGPDYIFGPPDNHADQLSEYRKGWLLDAIMPLHVPGVETGEMFFVPDESLLPLLVRPFDLRYVKDQPAFTPLRRLLRADNLALCVSGYQVFCADHPVHADLLGQPTRVFPLYIYPDTAHFVADSPFAPGEGGRRPNLDLQLILRLGERLGMIFIPDGRGDLKDDFGPEDVLYYLYAAFNSPVYRERYAGLMEGDLPRLPLPESARQFRSLARAGRDLARLHLLRRSDNWSLITGFNGPGTNKVEAGYPRYIELAGEPGGRIYINKEKFFSGVERPLWNMKLGGTQVLREWLAARAGQTLFWRDLHHYQQVIVALARSLDTLHDIDEVFGPD